MGAFVVTAAIFGTRDSHTGAELSLLGEYVLFLATLPGWIIAAKLYELYDRDEERTDHTTLDDFVGVLHLITVGVWVIMWGRSSRGLRIPSFRRS